MKTFRFETETFLPQQRAQVFNFFADPANLDRLTPPWLHFKILTPPTVQIRRGTLLDYRLRLHGIPMRWQSEIRVWNPSALFIDCQTKGPYSLWIHRHRFLQKNGGTLVRDEIDYAVPGGKLVQRLLVAPDIERIFQFRHKILQDIFARQSRGNDELAAS
jgi:ligand-binding SRPBCC domain-containing protein